MPQYESQTDRDNEEKVAKIVSELWEMKMWKLYKKDRIDFFGHRNDVGVFWAEIKCRPTRTFENIDKLGGYMLAEDKWTDGNVKARSTNLPFLLIVQDSTGELRYCRCDKIKSEDVEKKLGGRNDRPNDKSAIEPVVIIPMDRFEILKKGEAS